MSHFSHSLPSSQFPLPAATPTPNTPPSAPSWPPSQAPVASAAQCRTARTPTAPPAQLLSRSSSGHRSPPATAPSPVAAPLPDVAPPTAAPLRTGRRSLSACSVQETTAQQPDPRLPDSAVVPDPVPSAGLQPQKSSTLVLCCSDLFLHNRSAPSMHREISNI